MAWAKSSAFVYLAGIVSVGCYDWAPTSVAYVRAHPFDAIRVTDATHQMVIADHVVVEGNELLLVPAELARRPRAPRVDFVPTPPRLERTKLNVAATAGVATGIFLGVALVAVGVGNAIAMQSLTGYPELRW